MTTLLIMLTLLNQPTEVERIEYDRYINTDWEEAEDICDYVIYDESEPYLNPLIYQFYVESCEGI